MESGLPEIQKKVSQSIFYNSNDYTHSFTSYTYYQAIELERFYSDYKPIEWYESKKINHAFYSRTSRLKNKIRDLINLSVDSDTLNAIFLTLTFTDKTLDNTSALTRRRYVSRFLKQNCISYIANKDFGAKNGREHYHAVVLVNGILDYSKWTFGALNGKKIRSNEVSDIKLAKYVSKLTNHAIKETCKRNVLIYSRNL